MASIRDIAQLAGVSVSTVSRAFQPNSRIGEDTKKHILEIANALNYMPKEYKKRPTKGLRKNTIAVIVPCHENSWPVQLSLGIGSVMSQAEILPLYVNTNDSTASEISAIDQLKGSVLGFIVWPSSDIDNYYAAFLQEVNRLVPIVTLFRNTSIDHVDSIRIDSYDAVYTAISLLINNGHSNIGIVNGPMSIKPTSERLAAYLAALRENNLAIHDEYIMYGSFNEASTADMIVKALHAHPEISALFAGNAAISRSCLSAFQQLGLSTPKDIAFISYGDHFLFGLNSMGITCIAEPEYEIGRTAATLLLNQLQNYRYSQQRRPQRIIITPQIISRGSEYFHNSCT